MNKMTAAAVALLMLCSCGSNQDADAGGAKKTDVAAQKTAAAPKEAPVPLKDRDPEAYKGNLGSVMASVPEDRRADFQALLTCTMKQNAKRGRPAVLNAKIASDVLLKVMKDNRALEGCE